jgi:hypothetical protein
LLVRKSFPVSSILTLTPPLKSHSIELTTIAREFQTGISDVCQNCTEAFNMTICRTI